MKVLLSPHAMQAECLSRIVWHSPREPLDLHRSCAAGRFDDPMVEEELDLEDDADAPARGKHEHRAKRGEGRGCNRPHERSEMHGGGQRAPSKLTPGIAGRKVRRNPLLDERLELGVRTDWAARLLGAVLIIGAIPALVWVPEPLGGVLAFGAAAMGLFLIVVVAERAISAEAAQAIVQAQADQVAQVREGLKLAGRPIYVPRGEAPPVLFLPAADDDRRVPILDSDTVLYAGSATTKAGFTLPTAAITVAAALERKAGTRDAGPSGLGDLESRVGGALAAADLAHGLTVQPEGDGRLKADLRSGACDLPCLDTPERPDCLETGCTACHTVAGALAAALGKPVAVESATVQGRRVTLLLRPEGITASGARAAIGASGASGVTAGSSPTAAGGAR